MKTTKFLTAMMAVAIAMTFSSCQKGDTGATGAAGANGTNGSNGVANISSTKFTINNNWTTLTANYSWDYYYSIPAITNFNNDMVEVYFTTNSGGDWLPLPASNWWASGDALTYQFNNGAILIYYYLTNSGAAPTGAIYFNVVVIPPATIKQHPNTNWNDWSQVQSIITTQKLNSL